MKYIVYFPFITLLTSCAAMPAFLQFGEKLAEEVAEEVVIEKTSKESSTLMKL